MPTPCSSSRQLSSPTYLHVCAWVRWQPPHLLCGIASCWRPILASAWGSWSSHAISSAWRRHNLYPHACMAVGWCMCSCIEGRSGSLGSVHESTICISTGVHLMQVPARLLAPRTWERAAAYKLSPKGTGWQKNSPALVCRGVGMMQACVAEGREGTPHRCYLQPHSAQHKRQHTSQEGGCCCSVTLPHGPPDVSSHTCRAASGRRSSVSTRPPGPKVRTCGQVARPGVP